MNGVEGDRTLNLRIANAALSQLSYDPVGCINCTFSQHGVNINA